MVNMRFSLAESAMLALVITPAKVPWIPITPINFTKFGVSLNGILFSALVSFASSNEVFNEKWSASTYSKVLLRVVLPIKALNSFVSEKLRHPVALQNMIELSFMFSVWLNAYEKRLLAAWYFVNCFLYRKRLSGL